MKLLEAWEHVPQCPLAGDATASIPEIAGRDVWVNSVDQDQRVTTTPCLPSPGPGYGTASLRVGCTFTVENTFHSVVNDICCTACVVCKRRQFSNVRNTPPSNDNSTDVGQKQTNADSAKLGYGFQWINADAKISVDLNLNASQTDMFLELLYYT